MAATCGQLFVDDVLTAVNGVEVSTDQAAKQLILESVGDVVFSVIRPELAYRAAAMAPLAGESGLSPELIHDAQRQCYMVLGIGHSTVQVDKKQA